MSVSPVRSPNPPNYWYDEFQTIFRELQRRDMPKIAREFERGILRAATVQDARNVIARYKASYLTNVQNGGNVGLTR